MMNSKSANTITFDESTKPLQHTIVSTQWSPIVSFKSCKKVLNSGDKKYTDEEVKLISEWLWQLAKLNVESYFQETESREF